MDASATAVLQRSLKRLAFKALMIMFDTRTRLYGVIGHPVAHSLGPVMHNAAFRETGYPGVYLAFSVQDLAGAMTGLRALGLGGLSVTIPHKVAVLEHLDVIDPLAARIGAVNTVINRKGLLVGFNTDCYGALSALKERTELAGKRVSLLGAGGAARAVGFGLKDEGACIVIFNRNESRGRQLADELGAEFRPWSARVDLDVEIVVNTTSIGMAPHAEASPLPDEALSHDMLIMDIVYTPLETQLLRTARSKGCRIVEGLSMFIWQGARQFELWTSLKPPLEAMRQAVLAELATC